MAKKTYIGVNGTARRVKKIYIGIDGVARKIKKAYIGIGGVARPCFGSSLEYYGKITPLRVPKKGVSAASAGNYALFGGGKSGAALSPIVDAYDASLTLKSAPNLSIARETMAATSVGNFAIFACGSTINGSSSGATAIVDAYNCGSLTEISLRDNIPRIELGTRVAATSVGNFAIFAGGVAIISTRDGCYYYDTSLTLGKAMNLSESKYAMTAATVGDFAIFAGGSKQYNQYAVTDMIEVYDKGMTKVSVSIKLSQPKMYMAATTLGDYALFAGGCSSPNLLYGVVDCISRSLTKSVVNTSVVQKVGMAAITLDDYAIFAGGSSTVAVSDSKSAVVSFDSLLSYTLSNLSESKSSMAAATIGNFAIFAGGAVDTSTVEAYIVD